MRKILAALVLACSLPASAQFIGYVAPQTEQQTLATNTACTGSAQTFPIQNLGQTQHYLSVITGTQPIQFQAELDGIDRAGNVYRISDMLQDAFTPIIHQGQGSLFASGYYPKIQVVVTCSPNTATFTLAYSGAWATFNQNSGSYLNAQIDKVDFSNAPAGSNITDTFSTPFGSSAGTLSVLYSGSPPSGSTIKITCTNNQTVNSVAPALSVTLAAVATLQNFPVPATACPFVSVAYTAGGASVATVTAEYVLSTPGLTNTPDPCQNGSKKTSAAIAFSPATSTQVVAAVTGQSIYVCGYQVSGAISADTFTWEYGTGAVCATGTNLLTGLIGVTANSPVSYSGPGTVFTAPQSNALCFVSTGTGNMQGVVTYVQSP